MISKRKCFSIIMMDLLKLLKESTSQYPFGIEHYETKCNALWELLNINYKQKYISVIFDCNSAAYHTFNV